jgi:hypothetical protein
MKVKTKIKAGVTSGDLNSLEQAFANYGVGRFNR